MAWYAYCITEQEAFLGEARARRPFPIENVKGVNGSPVYGYPSGDFAVIGADISDLAGELPPSASCGPDERIVRIPRKTLVLAKPDIPDRI